jgi:DNA-binding GntR family transcriptional regulator
MVLVSDNDSATSHAIAGDLKEKILEGKYKPGMRLIQDELAIEFKASRSPIREALRMLEADGLVTIKTHSGAWITELDFVEFEELYQIRERVEPLMLRLSIPHLTTKLIKELEATLDKLNKATSVEQFLKLDREFHLMTYEGAATSYLGEIVQRMWNTTQPYRRRYSQILEREHFTSAHLEHTLLMKAIKRADLDDAERILYGHIRRTRLELQEKPKAE